MRKVWSVLVALVLFSLVMACYSEDAEDINEGAAPGQLNK